MLGSKRKLLKRTQNNTVPAFLQRALDGVPVQVDGSFKMDRETFMQRMGGTEKVARRKINRARFGFENNQAVGTVILRPFTAPMAVFDDFNTFDFDFDTFLKLENDTLPSTFDIVEL